MWYSVRVSRSLCAVFFAVVAVAFFSPGVAWAVPCVSVPAGTPFATPCMLNDLLISNAGSTGGGGGGGGGVGVTIDTTLLNPGLQLGSAINPDPLIFNQGSTSSSLFADIATVDASARIKDLSFSLLGLNITNGGTGTITLSLTGGGSIVLDQTHTSDSTSFTPISGGHFAVTIAGSCPSVNGCGSLGGLKFNFSELAAPVAVPEPSTWLLLLSGLAGFVIWRQRYTNS